MKTFLFVALAALGFVGSLSAQNGAYNPYADSNDFKVPVEADGTLNWPTFYKNPATQAKFKFYSEIGACRGSNMRIVAEIENNKVNVAKLPVQTISGTTVGANAGEIALLDADKKPMIAVLHPQGVTKLVVEGRMPLTQLRVGMFVRAATQVDAKGHGTETLKGIEVFTPDEKFAPTKAEGGRLENHAGRIARAANGKLYVKLASGKIPQIELPLDKETVVAVNGSQPDLIGPGDEIKVVGHAYQGEGAKEKKVFCSEIQVIKHDGREKPAKPSENTTAAK